MKSSTIIKKAKSFIGLTEYPPNSNNVIFNTDYYGEPVYGSKFPWCMVFVWDIFRMCGASDLFYDGKKTSSCPCLMEWAKKTGQFVTDNYKEGDVLFMDFDSIKDGDHTGFCVSDNGGNVTTIEGNTSPDNYGSQSNGGGVFERTRSKSIITGAYRPKYDTKKGKYTKKLPVLTAKRPVLKKGQKNLQVQRTQKFLNWYFDDCVVDGRPLETDKIFGENTRKGVFKFQQDMFPNDVSEHDGIVGPATVAKMKTFK